MNTLWLAAGEVTAKEVNGRAELMVARRDGRQSDDHYMPVASLERSEAEQLRDWLDRFLDD